MSILPDVFTGRTSDTFNDFGCIYLTGQGYVNKAFRGIGRDSALGWEEMVWGEEPIRNNAFALGTIDNIDIGKVARCEVNFKYFSYKDYLAFKRIINSRHFTVTFYDIDTTQWLTREMYCSSSEKQRIHNFGTDLLGVVDFTVKLVGTNNDLTQLGNTMTVKYYDANGTLRNTDTSTTWSQQYTLKTSSILPAGTTGTLLQWNTKQDGTGFSYVPNQNITLWDNLDLYAIMSQTQSKLTPVTVTLCVRQLEMIIGGERIYAAYELSNSTEDFGTEYTIPAFPNGYSNPIEWNTDKQRNGKAYKPGEKVTLVGDLALFLIQG